MNLGLQICGTALLALFFVGLTIAAMCESPQDESHD